MKSIHNMLVVEKSIKDIIANVFQTVFTYQTQNKLPHFILQNINSTLSEVTAYQLDDIAPLHLQTVISNIDNHTALKVDNRTSTQCKIHPKLQSTIKSMRKGHSRYTRTISMKSQNLQTFRDIKIDRQESTVNDRKLQLKQTSKSLIKLYQQTQKETQDFKNQQKLRHQLTTKRLNLEKITLNLTKYKQINFQKKEQAKNESQDFNKFVFHYDSTILRCKQNKKTTREQALSESSRNLSLSKIKPYEQISELDSYVEKHQVLGKQKKSINQISMPQIIQNSSQKKMGGINFQKSKSYHQQVQINEKSNKSVIDLISKQAKVQKGVVIKQSIDGKTEQLKRDSIQIERKVRELSKRQFQTSFAKKKFILRVQKTLNDI